MKTAEVAARGAQGSRVHGSNSFVQISRGYEWSGLLMRICEGLV